MVKSYGIICAMKPIVTETNDFETLRVQGATDIRRMSIAELLDGRTFFVPAYQRGYRWTVQQVEELLADLLTFYIAERGSDSYYCLQPVVVRQDQDNGRWEVIDGQQRLTTLKIILHFIRQDIGEDRWGLLGLNVYSIQYATREKSNDFIEGLGTESDKPSADEPIDFYYMRQAYETVKDWFYAKNRYAGKGAPDLCDRLHEGRDAALAFIKDLLVRKPTGRNATAQVLWYAVGPEENGIRLFNRLNTGKLELTDAELIKGLLLLRTNFTGTDVQREQEQFRKALQWERMENALHGDAFWSFLTPRREDRPNRIDLLLELVFREQFVLKHQGDGLDVEDELRKKHAVFNYYNDRFCVEQAQKQNAIDVEWEHINDAYSVLEDWYNDPLLYNLIGYVCQTRIAALPTLYSKFCDLKKQADKTRDDFIVYLKGLIKESFAGIVISVRRDGACASENYAIDLSYDDAEDVFKILLLLNVEHLNRRASGSQLSSGEREICKFPFAVLAKDWDIEHVDSRTVNALKDDADIKEWIDTAEVDLATVMTDEQRDEVARIRVSADPERDQKLIRYLREDVAHEIPADDDEKDNIGNLVLLDAGTNRSYKNALFVSKRKKIIKRREEGQYVPETTSYVFFKLFEASASARWQWADGDMQAYVNYIVQQLGTYLPKATEVNA